jgi:hypothetical protein
VSGEDITQPLIIFATYAARPELTEDDQLFASALERRGVRVRAASWDDPAAAWSSAAAVVIRSTWDYHLRHAEFLGWVDSVAASTALHNDARAVRWNSHKRYLDELAKREIRVIDTVFADAGSRLDVDLIARAHGWADVVVKPAVSASAHETRRFANEERDQAQAHLERLLGSRDVMVQPYLTALAERGELSLLYARGRFSHAVRRRSALVDEGSMPKSAATGASDAARRFAYGVLAAASDAAGVAPNELLYARVDLAESGADSYQLLELELVEPSLFLLHASDAAEHFAGALLNLASGVG